MGGSISHSARRATRALLAAQRSAEASEQGPSGASSQRVRKSSSTLAATYRRSCSRSNDVFTPLDDDDDDDGSINSGGLKHLARDSITQAKRSCSEVVLKHSL